MARNARMTTSRRALVQAGVGVIAAAAVKPAVAAPPKLAQSVVMYQDHPKGDQKCSICTHFLPPNACQIVAGDISPDGWCGVFTPKPA